MPVLSPNEPNPVPRKQHEDPRFSADCPAIFIFEKA